MKVQNEIMRNNLLFPVAYLARNMRIEILKTNAKHSIFSGIR